MDAEYWKIRILGVPLPHLCLCLLITAGMSAAFFWPAIAGFGRTLIGVEDIRLFVWLFWHYDNAFGKNLNPFFAPEIFYPPGISLARTSLIPLLSLTYHFLPDVWGVFGRITFIQLSSFILGGVFSFALAYRFARSFISAMVGSIVFNFSEYHLQSVLHHLNYALAIPFVALFSIFYFEMMERKVIKTKKSKPGKKKNEIDWILESVDRTTVFIAISLLLISLCELTVAIMAGFLVFLDIMRRYAERSGIRIITPMRMIILSGAVIAALLLSTYFSIAGYPDFVTYIIPPVVFIGTVFLLIGIDNLVKTETACRYLITMAFAALPSVAYIGLIVLLPSYPFSSDSVLLNSVMYSVPLEYLVIPTDLNMIAKIGIPSLSSFSESGVYVGLGIIVLLIFSFFNKGATDEEKYFRSMFFLALLFSFPIISIGNQILAGTPFFAMQLFPLLSLLRVPARFMLFAFLFVSVMSAIVIQRLFSSGNRTFAVAAFLIIILLVAERIPDYGGFIFSQKVPSFYSDLKGSSVNATIFLYPDFDYDDMLDEMYYQTVHGDPISYGVVSRFPIPSKDREGVYDVVLGLRPDNPDPARAIAFAENTGYTYIVVQKQSCADLHSCFLGIETQIDNKTLGGIETKAAAAFGKPVFEDDTIVVYKNV